ncbi:MAG: hypothetical protein HY507_01115 [Candidatus Zambryskibacteria bacterium]|nr:hypothetical protein [Candidatus Zambryskibacteria bacterium]
MSLYDGLKDAASILKEAGKIEEYRQILEAQEKMLEMSKKIEDLEEDNKELRKQQEIKGKLIVENNMYYIEENGIKNGPFCTSCLDSEQKPIRLHFHQDSGSASCPKCKITAHRGRGTIIHPRGTRYNLAI